jgi:phospholipase C
MRKLAVCLMIVGVLLVSSFGLTLAWANNAPTATPMSDFKSHINHIIFLMQENHAFDSLYGAYCPTTGPVCKTPVDGVPANTCVPISLKNASKGCVKPYNFTSSQLAPPDMPHDWNSTHSAINGGSMNDYYAAEASGTEPFGHYNATTAPVYYDIAEQYGLGENFFSSAESYSLPNHWFSVAASAPNESYWVRLQGSTATRQQQDLYLNESNATPSIEGELNHSKTSWDVYDFPLYTYSADTKPGANMIAASYWNPLASQAISYKSREHSHFVGRGQFFNDTANGTLPNVSWLIPSVPDSDHPPYSLANGQSWVASVVDAVEKSPEWNSTVLFISWDEYGGFYDQVAPPVLDPNGDSIRVPLLAISPWVRQGVVDTQAMDFDSILHLMENRFGLKCLGPRDCNAALPLAMFNFGLSAPRAPLEIYPFGQATYPMPLQSSGKLPKYGPAQAVPAPQFLNPTGPLPQNVDWS